MRCAVLPLRGTPFTPCNRPSQKRPHARTKICRSCPSKQLILACGSGWISAPCARSRSTAFRYSPDSQSRLWERAMSEQAVVFQTPSERLESIYHAHAPLLRATARFRYRVPPCDVDGLVHDVFASFLERQPMVRDIRAYLLVAISHACMYYWRKRRHETPLLPEHDDTRDDRTMSRADRWALHVSLGATLAQLGEKCRETLRRYYIQEEKPDAIARSMNTTPGYVFQLLHSCRKRARAIYRRLTEPAS